MGVCGCHCGGSVDVSMVFDVLYVLDGVNDLVDQLQCYSRDDSFCVGERSLECTEGDPRFLCRDTRE